MFLQTGSPKSLGPRGLITGCNLLFGGGAGRRGVEASSPSCGPRQRDVCAPPQDEEGPQRLTGGLRSNLEFEVELPTFSRKFGVLARLTFLSTHRVVLAQRQRKQPFGAW